MKIAKYCTCIALAGLAAARVAPADDSGPYVGAALGLADHAENVVLTAPNAAPMAGRTDGRDTAWLLTAGYRFNRYIALEVGYLQLGEMKASVADPSGESDARANFTFSTEGLTLALVGAFPVGAWEPYLRAGVLYSETELDYSGSVSGAGFGARIEDDDEDAIFGAGVGYVFRERWRAQLDLSYVVEAGDPEGGQSDYLAWLAGLSWRF